MLTQIRQAHSNDRLKYTFSVVTHLDSIQKQLLNAKQGRGVMVSELDSESWFKGVMENSCNY